MVLSVRVYHLNAKLKWIRSGAEWILRESPVSFKRPSTCQYSILRLPTNCFAISFYTRLP